MKNFGVPANGEAKKRGKQPKVFVEKKDVALELAQAIADTEESKSQEKLHRRQPPSQLTSERPDHKARTSSKLKLKQVTAALKAEKAKTKKDKAKARKLIRSKTEHGVGVGSSTHTNEKVTRKRVAFA